jgi:Tetratricopeptide repeat
MVSTSSALEPNASGNERAPTHAADDFSQFLKLAIEQLSRGKLEIALVAASEACNRAPHEPRTHYVYGQAWLALNQPARAQQPFGTAIRLTSGWADAWVNYGIARYRQGDIEDAKTAMREALARAPGHAAAGAHLGAFMRISGQSDAGEALLRPSRASRPTPARGSTSSPISSRANAPPRRSRCLMRTEAQLNAAITTANMAAAGWGTFTISLGANIALGSALTAINLRPGVSLDIEGNGYALDGGDTQRGLFVYSGALTVENLTLQNLVARGGTGGSGGGGGGAGLGGALFIANDSTHGAAPAQVALSDVLFSNDSAVGGSGSASVAGIFGGGGGLGGKGGDGGLSGGGGGGGGISAAGGDGGSSTSGWYALEGSSGLVADAAGAGMGGGAGGAGGGASGGGGGGGTDNVAGGGGGIGGASAAGNIGGAGGFGGGGGAFGSGGLVAVAVRAAATPGSAGAAGAPTTVLAVPVGSVVATAAMPLATTVAAAAAALRQGGIYLFSRAPR